MNMTMTRIDSLKIVLGIVFAVAALSGCAANRVELDDILPWTDEIIVREIGYGEKGVPIIGAALAKRPSRPGDRFTVVRLAGGRPVISYDIAVMRQKQDFAKPFRTVYEWTGTGFRAGAQITGVLADGFNSNDTCVEGEGVTVVELAIVAAPVTVGTVGGFVVGLADGIKQTALEMSKVVVAGEEAVTCTVYEYDHLGRLMFMRMYTPDHKRELVRTEYWYEGNETAPVRATVLSMAEGKKREIQ